MPADLHHPAGLLDRDVGGLGRLLDGRLAALLLEELLGDVAELGHRLDHVDRDADRPGLVGDGPGDRLADPPRRVGAELVAAAILVLVHRPHQAGVPLLDQVEEREAAVAVLLGDRDDQPEVAAGELALGLLVLLEPAVHGLDPAPERLRGLEGHDHQVLEFLLEVGAGPPCRPGRPGGRRSSRRARPSGWRPAPAASSGAGPSGSGSRAPRPA